MERPCDFPAVRQLAICASLCNDSEVVYDGKTGGYKKIGEATEVALKVLAEKVITQHSAFKRARGEAEGVVRRGWGGWWGADWDPWL